ncbi:efflux transporter outer membrane subunit [Candidatus Nitrosacidococcus sp. I8]|uniref:efflux transporter outer membrane subunit n=1 Tax=Candidatus Nitrosacidococcus sp. I8 TaxID=2942908 RepID=UPI0022274699|nr:efflux transporter outer membrane subunit [Candidatus Nitrosacidococcus sp. I8]CAH9018914.1 Outer membrane protein OprM [Candidatus Nitrosacidococcus sp. I8]
MSRHNTYDRKRYQKVHILISCFSNFRIFIQNSCIFLSALFLTGCINGAMSIDLAPGYKPEEFILPDSWRGAGPFAKANPSDGEIRPDWWKLYEDPTLDELEAQAMEANPDLHAAAERFMQARDMMMKSYSKLIPQIGWGFDASGNRQSDDALWRGIGENSEMGTSLFTGGAGWEPDFFSRIRNRTRIEIYHAEELAAAYALVRLGIQAELASNYYLLRGLDGQEAIYNQSIDYYKKLLNLVTDRFVGALAPRIDITRTQYLLYSTEARQLAVRRERQVTEHAIAVLVNQSPSTFSINSIEQFPNIDFKLPTHFPSTLLERRPDIAASERKMAQANRVIGIARAAFYPHVNFNMLGGFEGGFNLFQVASSLWSYGLELTLPIFNGGYRRAQVQQTWSAYRQTVDEYRSTVLNAFREVENDLSRTTLITAEMKKLEDSVKAAVETQNLTASLYTGGLASSLDLLLAQIQTLDSRINLVDAKSRMAQSTVRLVRSLGGGWNRNGLPTDKEIQPMEVLQYTDLDKAPQAGDVKVPAAKGGDYNKAYSDLSHPAPISPNNAVHKAVQQREEISDQGTILRREQPAAKEVNP